MTAIAVAEGINLLKHPLSAKRRSGAKALRKLQDPAAGPALLEAVRGEVSDSRTWETQYQMATAGIAGTLILTWLFYLYQRWRFDDFQVRTRQPEST